MKSLFAFVLLSATVFGNPQQQRPWRSQDGRSISGVFLSADEDSVTIRKRNGSSVEIPGALLHEEDWAYARELAEEARLQDEEARKEKEHADLLAGPLTYELSGGSENWPDDRRQLIVEAMESAITFLNKNANFKKHVWANNSPGTPTADANYEGWINWGGTINRRVALHEISHTLGVGTHHNWRKFVKDGKWTGEHANAQLREFDGPEAVLSADRMHFWPYGLNFDNESNPEADLRFIKMVEALRKDMEIANE
ncbi:hypothetical protein [Roseibacillus ishigakijimensis]|uniref:SLA1 homology domain-containing protein n=2 Tax=Roseibacillus ishigakijimensis TaxID=454146 RepID=A0A934VKW2_9BACT|nr:hypothetical protein [Roseibacillus ishigakijimensis]